MAARSRSDVGNLAGQVVAKFGRPLLALVVVGTILLSLWAQGCTGSRTDSVVRPDGGSGGRSGSASDARVGDLAADSSAATDAVGDGS